MLDTTPFSSHVSSGHPSRYPPANVRFRGYLQDVDVQLI
jgi:hypothetical protein